MTDESDTGRRELIQVVVKRRAFLDRLAEGAASKRELREELDLSRSTVYKAVRELEAHNLVEEDDGTVRLTLLGRLLYDRYRSLERVADDVGRHAGLLSVLPSDAPISADLLAGSEVVLAERHAPNRPVQRVTELVERSDRADVLAPVALPQYVELFHEQIVSDELTASIVFEPPVVEYLQDDYAELFEEAAATGRLETALTDAALPFGLVVTEGEPSAVIVIVYAEGGDLRGIVVNETPESLERGREIFERYRSEASLLTRFD